MNNRIVVTLAALAMTAGHAAAQCAGGFNGAVIPIPDMGMVTRTFECNSAGTIGVIQVLLRINHPRQGDLVIRLRHNASGVVATLMNRPGTEDGQSTEGYTAANLGGAELFVFDDAAAGPYAVPPVGAYPRPGVDSISGSFRPTVDSFAVFAGQPLNSVWTLEISDAAPGAVGTLSAFILHLSPAEPPTCYPNCDHSASTPFLNVNDFACFLNRYAGGESYANCDGSTSPPVLNVNDFLCFMNRFAAGCAAP